MCTFENSNKEKFTNKYIANDHIYSGRRRDGYDLLDIELYCFKKVDNETVL